MLVSINIVLLFYSYNVHTSISTEALCLWIFKIETMKDILSNIDNYDVYVDEMGPAQSGRPIFLLS